ncbi:hypothetical protein IPM62_00710 [Candidatus Woesebacteria bacterium]|nr:MAG: hypothetical protein IPM62_00710 [Candidatus Woesebacteria bacterium]
MARLIELAGRYLDNVATIYQGNDPEHTAKRKENVERGIEIYKKRYN